MKIQIARSVLNGFRKRALKKYPSEYMETVWGFTADGVVKILAFYPLDHVGTREYCTYSTTHIEEQQDNEDGPDINRARLLGTIHSHPDAPFFPSDADWETAREDGELISGIYQILPKRKGRKKTRIGFFADPLQSLEIL